jgi:hypothetical protein
MKKSQNMCWFSSGKWFCSCMCAELADEAGKGAAMLL